MTYAPVRSAGQNSVFGLFAQQVLAAPDAVALESRDRAFNYRQLNQRVLKTAAFLKSRGIGAGDRFAIASENSIEYVEFALAAARIGAIIACQNIRQSGEEMQYCITLVDPKLILASAEQASRIAEMDVVANLAIVSDNFADNLPDSLPEEHPIPDHGEIPLMILYTSGTTGKPKGAVISHRAIVARCMTNCAIGIIEAGGMFVAWPPLFHMVAMDNVLGMLMTGGKAVIIRGFDPAQIVTAVTNADTNWLVLMPGTIEPIIDEIKRRNLRPTGIKSIGCLPDLIPTHHLAEVTRLFNAPFRNTFGSTEAGSAPASRGLLGVGSETISRKVQSYFCEVRLVDESGNDVAIGQPGEALVRGPMTFSGYWGNDAATEEAFAGGWFHTGDVFIRHEDGTFDFVDRRKYLIKSGGENIYPAEIERILLSSDSIFEAIVVRQSDAKWGEVPVAFVVKADNDLTEADVINLCRGKIASYKVPKRIVFVKNEDLPRSITGKIVRQDLERRLVR